VDDLEAQITALSQQGVKVEPIRTDPITRQRFTFFQDPDGLPLELYELHATV
jgi:glyoxylase I family protein